MRTTYRYIVAGCGGIGSAALYWLSRRAGEDVLGLEQFATGHDRGGSQDHSRIIRLAYHAPAYTSLMPAAYAAWRTLEEESGLPLLVLSGGLDLEPADGAGAIEHYAAAMDVAGIPYQALHAREVMQRWPQFHLTDDVHALYQAESGIV